MILELVHQIRFVRSSSPPPPFFCDGKLKFKPRADTELLVPEVDSQLGVNSVLFIISLKILVLYHYISRIVIIKLTII